MGQFLFLGVKGAPDMDTAASASAPSSCTGFSASSPFKAAGGPKASSKFMAAVFETCTIQQVRLFQHRYNLKSCNPHWQRCGAKEAS